MFDLRASDKHNLHKLHVLLFDCMRVEIIKNYANKTT